MPAYCRCPLGHTFRSRVLEDDPETNSFSLAEEVCPECGTEDFEVLDVVDDDEEDY